MSDRKSPIHADSPESEDLQEAAPEDDVEATEDGVEEADSPEVGSEDEARGYRISRWKGLPNYEALDGSMATLDERQIQAHVRRRGLIQE